MTLINVDYLGNFTNNKRSSRVAVRLQTVEHIFRWRYGRAARSFPGTLSADFLFRISPYRTRTVADTVRNSFIGTAKGNCDGVLFDKVQRPLTKGSIVDTRSQTDGRTLFPHKALFV
jgi:hypothetical protein